MLAKKTNKKFIFEALEACDICMVNFDLWMSKGGVDTFVLIVHFLNHNWELGHITIGMFEIAETSGVAMAIQVNEVIAAYVLNVKIMAYVKDENNNLNIMTNALTSFVFYKLLGLTTPFIRSCWGHAMSKCCQYAIDDTKVFIGLTSIPIKECQSILQKTITWTKKSGKSLKSGRKLVWIHAYIHTNKNSSEDEICFKNDFILKDTKIQKHNCMLL
jgi:hypothetical protein